MFGVRVDKGAGESENERRSSPKEWKPSSNLVNLRAGAGQLRQGLPGGSRKQDKDILGGILAEIAGRERERVGKASQGTVI